MTEMAQGMSQSPDTSNSVPVSTPAPAVQATESREERTFKQSEVTDIVKRERQEAIDRFRRLQSEQPEYVAQKYGENRNASPNQSGSFDENHYRKIAAEEAQRLRDQWMQDARNKHEEEHARNTVTSFQQKLNEGREKYQDFDNVTGDIEYAAFPNVVQILANHIENAKDVLYSLGQDLTKMEVLESLANRSPKAAIAQARRLAESLAKNEAAKNVRIPNEPLGQLRPSNTGVDNGAMSVKDYRKIYKV